MAGTYFSLDEARALLPKVERHLQRALQLHVQVRLGTEELVEQGYEVTAGLLGGHEQPDGNDDGLLARTQALYQTMVGEVDAIRALGAEVKGLDEGLVDFWSFLDGETEVLLCWKLGESTIEHYHAPEAGFAGRRSLAGHTFESSRRSARPQTSERS
jgi:hypothetical protein